MVLALIKWAFDPPPNKEISGNPDGEPLEFHLICSRRDAVASSDLEIIDGIHYIICVAICIAFCVLHG